MQHERLALGTVQFGLPYGVAHAGPATPLAEVVRILQAADAAGICTLDTAHLYGDAESVIGEACRQAGLVDRFDIISKTPKFPAPRLREADGKALIAACRQSLQRTGASALAGLLLHDVEDLFKPGGEFLFEALFELRDDGLVDAIGASVYDARQLDELLSRMPVDLVQVPVSVFDQRLLRSGHLRALHDAGIEVHARSALWQGLACLPLADWPAVLREHLAGALAQVTGWHDWLHRQQVPAVTAALKFCLDCPDIDYVVCGAQSTDQWQELIVAADGVATLAWPSGWADALAIEDPQCASPAGWPTLSRA